MDFQIMQEVPLVRQVFLKHHFCMKKNKAYQLSLDKTIQIQ